MYKHGCLEQGVLRFGIAGKRNRDRVGAPRSTIES